MTLHAKSDNEGIAQVTSFIGNEGGYELTINGIKKGETDIDIIICNSWEGTPFETKLSALHIAVYDEKIISLEHIYKVNGAHYAERKMIKKANEILKQAVVKIKKGKIENVNFDFSQAKLNEQTPDLITYYLPKYGYTESIAMIRTITGITTSGTPVLPETKQNLFLIPKTVILYYKNKLEIAGIHHSINSSILRLESPHILAHEIFHTWIAKHVNWKYNLMQATISDKNIRLKKQQWDLAHKEK
jgi:hypothetical protein